MSAPLSIAFFVSDFPKLSETFVVDQITGLLAREHRVIICADRLCPDAERSEAVARHDLTSRAVCRRSALDARPWRRVLTRLGLAIAAFPRRPGLVLRAVNPFAWGRRALTLEVLDRALFWADHADHATVDVVHCHFGPNGTDAAVLKRLGVLRCPLVVTFHGYDTRAGLHDPGMYRLLAEEADVVHSISRYSAETLARFGFAPDRIVHHPMGIDMRGFRPAAATRNGTRQPVTLITVARLVPEKTHDVALRAVAAVVARHPQIAFRYRLIGDGPLLEDHRALARELGLEDVVEFAGAKDRREIADALRAADLFLLSSAVEILPVSIMEAMACALPVVATDVGSVAELVRDRETGRLVPPGDPDALAGAIDDLLARRADWPTLGAAGRALVGADYDIEVLNDRLVAHYETLLGPC